MSGKKFIIVNKRLSPQTLSNPSTSSNPETYRLFRGSKGNPITVKLATPSIIKTDSVDNLRATKNLFTTFALPKKSVARAKSDGGQQFYDRVDTVVLDWFESKRRCGIPVSPSMFRERAKMVAKDSKYNAFQVNKWFLRFRKKHFPFWCHPEFGADDKSSKDSMPLDQRLALPQGLQTKEDFASSGLQTQPASPPKLKVTRISTAAAAAPSPPKLEPAQPTTNDEVCLRWNSHHSNMQSTFPNLLQREQYVDVTLAAEGKTLKCHRLILSSCSPYFEEILNTISPFQHPVIFMKDVPFWVLKSLCDFMYAGEVNIQQNNLEELLRIAEMLKIKGLTGKEVVDEEKQKVVEQPKVIRVVKPTPPKVLQTTKTLKPIKMLKTQAEKPSEPLKKPDVYDPLDLLEPLYEEKADLEPVPGTSKEKQSPLKKQTGKKPKKRKHTSPEPESPAPSVFQTRKGTRSRPNIKVPKFFDTNYTKEQEKKSEETSLTDPAVPSLVDPLYEIEEIKAEPIDFEDNLLEFRDDEGFMDTTNEESIIGSYDSPLVNTLNPPIPAESNHTLPEINMVVPPDIPQDVPELVPIKSVEERSSVEKTMTPSKEDLNEIKTDVKKTEDLCPPLVSLVQKQSKKIDILESSEVVQSTDKSHSDKVTDTGETETPNSATDFEAPEEIGTGFNELSVEPLEEMGTGNNAMNESPGETGTQSNKTNIDPPGEIRTENN